jgi:hypothetical protein
MSEPRPGQHTTLPSIQHTGTEDNPPSAALAHDSHTLNKTNAVISISGPRDANDEYSPVPSDSNERDSSLDQTSPTGSSPQSRPVHGKIACQECVSESSVCRNDV